MKKVALLLAAAMLALAGCASAGDTAAASEAAPAESTAESAAAEDSTEAALPGEPHPLSAYSACAVSGNCVYAAVTHFSSSEDSLGSFDHSTVYKTDLTTGQTYEMYRTDSQLASAPLIIDDTLYFICYDGGMLALPTTGGEARVLPFSYDDWMPVFYAGHYLYCRSVSAAPFCRTDGMRFNLENGETAPWNIPVETMYIPDVVGDALLLCRVVSDYPVPYPDDDEMSQALLQNTTLEYTLADPATGAVRQTCFTLPYDIPQPGSLTIYTYLGKCGSDFYFRADQCDDEYAFVSQSVLRIGTDGTRTDLGITKTPDYIDYSAVLQGDEVRWLLTRGTDGIYLIYDTQGHEIGRNERPAGLEAFFPLCMLDDGRLLMVVGYDWEHDSLKISNGKWCWFSRGIGGYSALDYLIKVKEMPFTQAVETIMGKLSATPPAFSPAPKVPKEKVLLLPQANRSATHAVEYLHRRGIDYELIDFCIKTGRLYESYPYHNVVFVGMDADGKPRYANQRGIGSDFIGDANGSDKHYSFGIPAAATSDTLHLFESAVDLLSYGTMQKLDDKDWRSENLLSLAGVYKPRAKIEESSLPAALVRYLAEHPHISRVVLRLDNDATGRVAAETIKTLLPGKYAVTVDIQPPPQGKDYNDCLCLRLGLPITKRGERSKER